MSCSSKACDWTTGRKGSHSNSNQLTDKQAAAQQHSHTAAVTSIVVRQAVAAILGGPGGQRTPHFPEWGVTYKAVTPSFGAMLMSLFSLYILVMDGPVVVDQVLLWFRPSLILSRIPDYNVCVNVNRLKWCDHCKKSMTVRYDMIHSRALSVEV